MKKLLFSLILVISLMIGSNVHGKIISINDVINEYNNNVVTQNINSTASINNTSNTVDLYFGGEKLIDINFTADYFEFDNTDNHIAAVNPSEANTLNSKLYAMNITFLASVYSANGNMIETFQLVIPIYEYDKYGIEINARKQTGFTYQTYDAFKITRHEELIDLQFNRYGTPNVISGNYIVDNNVAPTITSSESTSNSVTLKPHVEGDGSGSSYKAYCNVYRKTSKTATTVTKVNDNFIDCLKNETIVDKNLSENTTYYYYVTLYDNDMSSNTIEVKTKGTTSNETVNNTTNNTVANNTVNNTIVVGNNTVTNTNTNISVNNSVSANENVNVSNNVEVENNNTTSTKNPNTGVSLPVLILTILSLGAISLIAISNKKQVFKKI